MAHKFGNIDTWTSDKLEKVEAYLDAYLTALKNQNFKLEYIDAFAGTGFVTRKIPVKGETLFELDETVRLKDFIDGSARVALQTSPPFSVYRFIEKNQKRVRELEKLKDEFPNRSIQVIHGEANIEVRQLCNANWISQNRRAVMFLDPYGTQVSWDTIKAIADTQAIDLWILFPIGAVNRLLNKDGGIKDGLKRRLDSLFGSDEWFAKFYSEDKTGSLPSVEFAGPRFIKTADPFKAITEYFIQRLKTIFASVTENPLVMRNSTNSPIFLLCFAAGNPKGAPIATKIAKHILGKN